MRELSLVSSRLMMLAQLCADGIQRSRAGRRTVHFGTLGEFGPSQAIETTIFPSVLMWTVAGAANPSGQGPIALKGTFHQLPERSLKTDSGRVRSS